MSKKPLTSLFRENPETPEGKYLVKRRDGTVVEWPNFVLGARDPIAQEALLSYCKEVCYLIICAPEEAKKLGFTAEYAQSLNRYVAHYEDYRREHGAGDPGMGAHRKDDPATIEEMKKGHSA